MEVVVEVYVGEYVGAVLVAIDETALGKLPT
jgi:hypothetical protein